MLYLISLVCFLYLGAMVFAAIFANDIIFPKVPPSYRDGPDTFKLKTSEGASITSMYLEAPGSNRLLLYSHGNGEDIGMVYQSLERFQEEGISVLLYDYPGYGTSSHKPTETGVYAAAEAVYTYATQTLNFTPEQIVLYGYSLGSGPSCWLAEQYPIRRLILEGAFSSAFRVLSGVKLLPWDRFDNLSRFSTIDCPILMIHGTRDRIVPFSHAKRNWKFLSGDKQKLWVEGAGHLDLQEVAGPIYWETVIPFIKSPHD